MIEFDAATFFNLLRFLSKIEHESILDKTDLDRLDQPNIAGIDRGLKQLKHMCDSASLHAASRNIQLLIFQLHIKTVGQIRDNIKDIKYIIERDASEMKYFHMPPDEAHWYTNERPFGDSVDDKFRSSTIEVIDAAKCFATGNYTASVYHCMRVLESGLCAFART